MRNWLAVVVFSLVGVGCAPSGYRYRPEPQPAWANLYADYQQLQDAVAVVIETDGRRLEDVYVDLNGEQVRPVSIVPPNYRHKATIGSGLGVFGGHVGGGVGGGIPIGEATPVGPTTANFEAVRLGPPPWMVHVKVAGIDPVVIRVGGAPNVK